MDEPKDTPPSPEGGPRIPLTTVNAPLSPIQQAYADYTGHATRCPSCRDVGAGPCSEAEGLWRAYQAAGAEACRRLAGETA